MTPSRRTLAGLLLAAATCTGCAGGSVAAVPSPPAAVSSPPSPAAPATTSPDRLGSRSATLEDLRAEQGRQPVAVRISGAGHAARVEARTTDPVDGGLDLPDDALTVAWWSSGSGPGDDTGSVVLAAHVSYLGQTGPFTGLAGVHRGAEVVVESADGERHRYVVQDVRSAPKTELDREALFRTTGPAQLALVTCGGAYDAQTRSYASNVVVTATPA